MDADLLDGLQPNQLSVSSAATLTTPRAINVSVSGVNGTPQNFNGSGPITIPVTLATLTRGSYLTGDNYNGGTARTWSVDATSANTASKVVARDSNGDFSMRDLTLRNGLASGSLVAKYLSSTYTTDYPIGSASVFGTFKAGSSLIANAGTLDQRNRHYTTTTSYTDAAARDITAEIPIGTGSLQNTEAMSLQLPFLPSSTTKTVTGNILINPTTWSGTGLNVTFLDNGTNYVAFITNYSGSTIVKDGIKITVMAKQTV